MTRQPLGWYVRRLQRMSPAELFWRTQDQLRRTTWSSARLRPGQPSPLPDRRFGAVLPSPSGVERALSTVSVPDAARKAVIATADSILAGNLEVLGVQRTDLREPDWFRDPVTGRRSDPTQYAFRINHRSEEHVGNIKQVWELSRHHHLCQLAAAWFLTHDEAYAELVAEQLRSWWRENPFLSGVHWTSGIEVGIRLISWTWIRRLLSSWGPVADLFENNDLALRQIYWHQRYLAAFQSRGSSANNHVIAEAAGQLVAACAFPWFKQSARWRSDAAVLLERELDANTFPSGVNRELATDYHRFVAELGLLAAVEAGVAGHPVSEGTWTLLTRMFDAATALVDETLRPPRQGDDDEGRVLVIDPPDAHHWSAFLSLGAAVVGPAAWWPTVERDVVSTLVGALADRSVVERRGTRPDHFADAGITLLRTTGDGQPEIWCRCDGGPHGFLSIAAHAHADALSLEVRVGGVDVLADPGTYCYHGEETWRNYFRSTLAHNTVEIAGRDQSTSGGPFLWLQQATGHTADVSSDHWSGLHDGYAEATHHRTVHLDPSQRTLTIEDRIDGPSPQDVRIPYHLGPEIIAHLPPAAASSDDATSSPTDGRMLAPTDGRMLASSGGEGALVTLEWPTGVATVELPDGLVWTAHRGETDPPLGWYSPRFGQKVPTTTLLGTGRLDPGTSVVTTFRFRG